jgi:hypothetical protein
MIPEIGDKFIINWENFPSDKACKFPHLEFTIESFSKTGLHIYFRGNRTNKKCSCIFCKKKLPGFINLLFFDDIIITQKKLSIERSGKLKSLGL